MVCLAKYFISEAIGDAGLGEHARPATVIFASSALPTTPAPASTTVSLEQGCQQDLGGGVVLFCFMNLMSLNLSNYSLP